MATTKKTAPNNPSEGFPPKNDFIGDPGPIAKKLRKKEQKVVQPESLEITHVSLLAISSSPTNPRKSISDDSIRDLADAMKEVGLMHPITLRPDADGYEIVSGERRYLAAKLLDWETIPSVIRDITDEQLLKLQIIENLHREDIAPLDEAAAFKAYLKSGSMDWLCSQLHKSKRYVQDRLKLNDLIDEAKKHLQDGVLPITHAIIISKLQPAEQEKCIKQVISEDYITDDRLLCTKSVSDLKFFIENSLMLDFDQVCFDLDDPDLIPEAGSCAACSKRTCNQNLLFNEITQDDMCTDPACYHAKEKAHVARSLKAAKVESSEALAGDNSGYGNKTVKVKGVEVSFSPTKKKGTVPVVITKSDAFCKSTLGSVVYINPKDLEKKQQEKEERKADTAQTRSESWEARSRREFIETEFPNLQKVAALLKTVKLDSRMTDIVMSEYIRDLFINLSTKIIVGLYQLLMSSVSAEDVLQLTKELDDDDAAVIGAKAEIADKLIALIGKYEYDILITVYNLLVDIDGKDSVRTQEEKEKYNNYRLNFQEIMQLIEGKETASKGKKKAVKK